MKTNSAQMRAQATVYAKVLLEAAEASDKVLEVAGEFDELLATVRGSIELRNALTETTLPSESKRALVSDIFAGYSAELLTTFEVMVERGDLSVLARTHERYTALAEEALGAVIVDVTTVIALDDDLREQITAKYSKEFGANVLLREHLDPNLIGGIILSAHGKRIDASVQAQLEGARQVLSKTV